jgi:glycosyltransferase involved in cell wall biosynthesis
VAVVPKSDAGALAQAVVERLTEPRRTLEQTARTIAERFRLEGVTERYLGLYAGALAS